MADYVLRGTSKLVTYIQTLGLNQASVRDRAASAVGIPRINLSGNGMDAGSYVSPKYSEAKAQALAGILGVTVANVTTNGGQEIVG